MDKKTLCIVGCGYLGNVVAGAWKAGLLPGYDLAGVYSRTFDHAQLTAQAAGCRACRTLEELLEEKPDFVVETAGGPGLREIAVPVLRTGAQLVVISAGAFADEAFLEQVRRAAQENGTRVHIASGAVGGFDVLRTVALMARAKGEALEARLWTHKGPASLKGTPVFSDELMASETERDVFDGSAREAIAQFPTKVNVAVAAALASAGAGQTGVKITSVPGFVGDDHRITAQAAGVRADVDIYSETSEIAGWSIVSLLQNLASPLVFY